MKLLHSCVPLPGSSCCLDLGEAQGKLLPSGISSWIYAQHDYKSLGVHCKTMSPSWAFRAHWRNLMSFLFYAIIDQITFFFTLIDCLLRLLKVQRSLKTEMPIKNTDHWLAEILPLDSGCASSCIKAAFPTLNLSFSVDLKVSVGFAVFFFFNVKYVTEQLQNVRPQETLWNE